MENVVSAQSIEYYYKGDVDSTAKMMIITPNIEYTFTDNIPSNFWGCIEDSLVNINIVRGDMYICYRVVNVFLFKDASKLVFEYNKNTNATLPPQIIRYSGFSISYLGSRKTYADTNKKITIILREE